MVSGKGFVFMSRVGEVVVSSFLNHNVQGVSPFLLCCPSAHHYLVLPEESELLYDMYVSVMGAEVLSQQTASFSEPSLLNACFTLPWEVMASNQRDASTGKAQEWPRRAMITAVTQLHLCASSLSISVCD